METMSILRQTSNFQCFVFFLFSLAISNVKCICDQSTVIRVKECTESMAESESSINFLDIVTQSDIALIRYRCGNGDFLTAVNCIERVMEECQGETTDEAHYLRGMFNIDQARETVRYFCTQIKVYESHSECIAGHDEDKLQCAQIAMDNFQTQVAATSNMDSQMRFECTYRAAVVNCVQTVLKVKCAKEAVDLVKRLLDGFEPPFCTETLRAERTDSFVVVHENKSHIIVINGLWLLVTLLIMIL